MKSPKVLILTSNYGNGHHQVAKALQDEFIYQGVFNVLVRDLYYETSPRLNEWTRKMYLKSYTLGGRQIYRLFYYSSKELSKRKNLKLLSYGYSRLKKIIEEEEPDVIINTFPSFAVPSYRSKTNTWIPNYNVITDYCLHHSWVHPGIDKYYVATSELANELVKSGVRTENILVSGIPIKREFYAPYNKNQLVEKYHLSSTKPTVLIIAGAFGVSKGMKEVSELLKDDTELQLLIVCGKNEELFNQLQLRYQMYKNIHVYGFVTEMEELLKIADCVITKPGGVILSEALATNTPVLLPKATPGQERENAAYFHKRGGAIWNEKADQLVDQTKKIMRDSEKLDNMKQSLSSIWIPQSASRITNDILQDYSKRVSPKTILKA
ncbi:MGDG synthase family glycosyltransferase [Evansella tamaricis]|uniref:Glycosyltransferase n=1 Tax=Evansella tamaricis TaxID=2069301 RepID=A0ABS6JJJ2_9BACI|nr:glycosyltransferase [Evansella tamaricis]MBU9713756.1 glycosyltransferase [Evansella tamaricis]